MFVFFGSTGENHKLELCCNYFFGLDRDSRREIYVEYLLDQREGLYAEHLLIRGIYAVELELVP